MSKKEDFLKRILATFRIEAEENINSMYSDLIKLEKENDDSLRKELIEVIYRSSHSLKGASRAVNLNNIESVCHAFEGVMSAVREGEISFTASIFDSLHKTVDIVSELLNVNEEDISDEFSERISRQLEILSSIERGDDISEKDDVDIPNLKEEEIHDTMVANNSINELTPIDNKDIISKEKNIVAKEKTIANRDNYNSTIRVSNSKLDKLLFQAEEMLEIKLAAINRKDNLRAALDKLTQWDKEYETYFPKIQSLKRLSENSDGVFKSKEDIAGIVNFFEWADSSIKDVKSQLNDLFKTSDRDGYYTGVKIDSLLDDVKDIITIPFSSLLNVFPKMVRDVAKDLGKEVDFEIMGGEIEIDRRVLEKIKDPLIHILRNSIDYGVEAVNDRIKKTKPLKGRISLKIERLESNKVQVVLEDDGAGIDIEKIKKIYINNENVNSSDLDKISTKDCINYIFKSGISTSDIVTDISGRGVGLAIVQDNIEQLGGTVDVETQKDKYTRFRLTLPLSLVTYRGVILKVAGHDYIVPTSKVEKVLRLGKNEIKTIENKNTFTYDGEIIPLVNLAEILRLSGKGDGEKNMSVIILNSKSSSIGFVVESVIGEQEVLVKKFNRQLSRVKYVSGATILGSGKVVPILNISDLFKSALEACNASIKENGVQGELTENKKSILIVEDSVTSRMLLKNILESSGFRVVTAIDGIDGFTKLKEDTFDAVVSDIEMPRMNGFELTEKIRSDEVNKSVPVVLVTSLSKREHREKGIDVGANAYIVKSSFDHSNLLEILNRLI